MQVELRESGAVAELVAELLDSLRFEDVRYCHWKSNLTLSRALAGDEDLDLLVARESLPRALGSLTAHGFKEATLLSRFSPPGVRHFYGHDRKSGKLIHVHLYNRVITGESLLKGHALPFEAMLLDDARVEGQVRVASRPAELVVFVLRMFIKYGSALDLSRLIGTSASVRRELEWLEQGDGLTRALALLEVHCPPVDASLFRDCVEALRRDASLLRRYLLARAMRRRLRIYAVRTRPRRALDLTGLLLDQARRRLIGNRLNKIPRAGGAVIAFVGADATGKSTLSSETARWLGETFAVRTAHLGKPPSSWLTIPLNVLLPLARRLSLRGGRNAAAPQQQPASRPSPEALLKRPATLPNALRAAALAWDRSRLAQRVARAAARGELVVCDRYPAESSGAPDGPRLIPGEGRSPLQDRLARIERRLYRNMPPPDLVLRLQAPVDTAKRRNRAREESDGEEYLEARHVQILEWSRSGTKHICDIDTDRPLSETIAAVKDAVWRLL